MKIEKTIKGKTFDIDTATEVMAIAWYSIWTGLYLTPEGDWFKYVNDATKGRKITLLSTKKTIDWLIRRKRFDIIQEYARHLLSPKIIAQLNQERDSEDLKEIINQNLK